MTEQELRDWFALHPAQPQDYVEKTLRLKSAAHMRELAVLGGETITDEQAEERARAARREFVEAVQILRAGGALSPDGWRPGLEPLL